MLCSVSESDLDLSYGQDDGLTVHLVCRGGRGGERSACAPVCGVPSGPRAGWQSPGGAGPQDSRPHRPVVSIPDLCGLA